MSNFLTLVGERIRLFRKTKDLTQEELAEKATLHYSYIGGVERGARNISLETLEKIANALEVQASELFKFGEIEIDPQLQDKQTMLDIHHSLLLERGVGEIQTIHNVTKEIIKSYDAMKDSR